MTEQPGERAQSVQRDRSTTPPPALHTTSRIPPGRLKLWLVGLTLIGAFIWVISVPYVLFAPSGEAHNPSPDVFLFWRHTFVFSDAYCKGGAYESVPLAAAVGIVLWVTAGVAGWRLRRRRGSVMLAFAALYAVALVVLWHVVAPAIWGHAYCLTD